MKILFCLLMLPMLMNAQTSRELIALTINYEPDHIEGNNYYLITDKVQGIAINQGQTFLLQSTWKVAGDSVVNIGEGTVQNQSGNFIELSASIYPGKNIMKGDIALFLVPLEKPKDDTLFFKFARLGINFRTIGDSNFYERSLLLQNKTPYSVKKLLKDMTDDIRYTGDALHDAQPEVNQQIKSGAYKGNMMFTVMQEASSEDV